MSATSYDHTYTEEDINILREIDKARFFRDTETLEIKIIEFATRHNLLAYLDKHKAIAIQQADVIIPFTKQQDFSIGDTNLQILLSTEREILKDLTQINPKQIPHYIKDWISILNLYASCFFFPQIECTSEEEKKAVLSEIKQGFMELDPLFLIDKRTNLRLTNGIPFRLSIDINPASIQKYFIAIFSNIKKVNRKTAKEKLGKVISQNQADVFLDKEKEAARYALRCLNLFVELFSQQIDQKLREICQDTLTIFNLQNHRGEDPEIERQVKEACFNDLLQSRTSGIKTLLNYDLDNNSPKSPGRPKTFKSGTFLKEVIKVAKKIGQTNKEPSLKKIAKELGWQEQKLKTRLDQIGMDRKLFYSLITQAAKSEDTDKTNI